VLDVIRESGLPSVVTLQDYFPLCSTFKLLDSAGRVCLRREIGADCATTTAADPRSPGVMVEATVRHELHRFPSIVRRLTNERVDRLAERAASTVKPPPAAAPAAFQRRRDANVARLNRVDRLVAMSPRLAEIYALLGVDPARIETRQFTLAHIERLRPREPRDTGGVLTFGTINGLSSVAKGGELLLEAVRIAAGSAPAGSFRLAVLGPVNYAFDAEVDRLGAIERRGFYGPGQLDALLDDVFGRPGQDGPDAATGNGARLGDSRTPNRA
jgi:hypothetical protein